MIGKIVEKQIKYSKIIVMIIIIFMIGAISFAKDLKIETDFGKLVGDYGEHNSNQRVIENAFQVNDAMVVLIKEDRNTIIKNPITDMRNEQVTQYISDLSEVLSESQYVVATTPPEFSSDYRYVRFNILLFTPNSVGAFNEVKQDLELYMDSVGEPKGIKAQLTGLPTLLERVSSLLIIDNIKTIGITIIFMFLILYWYLRDITFTLITLTTPVFSLIILAGAMTYLGINVSIMLAAVGILVLGLGADYSIHIVTHYRQLRRELSNHKLALVQTIKDLFIPITASFITTLAGFVALIFGVSNSSQEQGIVLSIGIVVIFLVSFISFPVFLTLFRNKISNKPNETFRKIVAILSKLAIYQTHNAKKVITIISILTIVMMYGASQVKISTSNSNWIPEGDTVSDTFRELSSVYGNEESLTLVIKSTKGDLRNVHTVKDLSHLETLIKSSSYVESISSPFSDLEANSNQIYDSITNTQLKNQFNYDFTVSRIVINSQNLGVDEEGKSVALQEIRKLVELYPIYGAEISFYGDPVRFDELGDTLQADAGFTTIVSLILVFIVAALIYASITVGLIALIPIILAVIWGIGFMGYLNVPFTTLSTSIIALVIGIGIDFSIHLVDSVKRFIKKTDLEDALIKTLETSGAAILLSSFTTFIGFMALLFATLLGTQRLGMALAFSILAVFIVTITLVPAILSIVYKDKKKKIKKRK